MGFKQLGSLGSSDERGMMWVGILDEGPYLSQTISEFPVPNGVFCVILGCIDRMSVDALKL